VLLIMVIAVGVLFVPVFRGSLRSLATLRFKGAWMLPLAYLLQIVALTSSQGSWRGLVHVSSYVVAAGFLWFNRHIAGILVVALGAALNAIAIAANDGVMPATARATEGAGLGSASDGFANSAVLAHPHLAALGDVFWTPRWFPFSNVFSIGDVLIAVGAITTIHLATGSALTRWMRRAEPATPSA
jgi:hypothetical protein